MLYGSYHHIENLSNPKGKNAFIPWSGIFAKQTPLAATKNRRSPKETYWYSETVVPIAFHGQ